eukprot:Anaeramoba_ignava/a219873_28.p1 GENE.a219873_28~~a219873_28.p1  ORF type:complete len:365 (+),score=105.18 a219873_28:109-1095(+)
MGDLGRSTVETIDTYYNNSEKFAAAFLLREQEVLSKEKAKEKEEVAFIENNTNKAIPFLLDRLEKQNIAFESVKYLIVTHIHLDHAGATSQLVRKLPNATVVAHPRAVPHLINPSKLIAGVTEIYGKENFEKLYGEILPIEKNRIKSVEDYETLQIGSRNLTFIHTRGHAKHHMCVYDSVSKGIFTGDSFGISYPLINKKCQNLSSILFPSTSPIDFEPDQALLSLDKIINTGASHAYLTHYGIWEDLQFGKKLMTRNINKLNDILLKAKKLKLKGEKLLEFCQKEVDNFFIEILAQEKIVDDKEAWERLYFDRTLNAEGIAFCAEFR